MTPTARADLSGGAWLLADMALNLAVLTVVKALGLAYPAAQIVFLRAATGLLAISPWLWRARGPIPLPGLQALRVALSALALTLGYHAVARLPFALFTAVNFTRPLVLMALAALLLGERIGPRRWTAAAVAMAGVLLAVDPSGGLSPPVLALLGAVLAGTGAIVATRRLRETPPRLLMAFYCAGLTVLSAPFAALSWVPLAPDHIAPLLAVGLLAQAAQACFLQAHGRARAGFLAVLGYLTLVLSGLAGYLVFGEVPTPVFLAGAALVVAAALWVTLAPER